MIYVSLIEETCIIWEKDHSPFKLGTTIRAMIQGIQYYNFYRDKEGGPQVDRKVLSIEMDCPPGAPRPGDLLPDVLAGTGIVIDPEDAVSRSFGNWKWIIPVEFASHYDLHRELIKSRIQRLYKLGRIRYGSY